MFYLNIKMLFLASTERNISSPLSETLNILHVCPNVILLLAGGKSTPKMQLRLERVHSKLDFFDRTLIRSRQTQ